MIKVKFISADGDQEQEVDAKPGDRLLEVAQAAGQPLEGTCEGQMACSTCHVIVDKSWFDKLPTASDDEEDMLDLASGARRTSRLSCQILLDDALDGLIVHVPSESRNMQGV
jgi:ferredoxin